MSVIYKCDLCGKQYEESTNGSSTIRNATNCIEFSIKQKDGSNYAVGPTYDICAECQDKVKGLCDEIKFKHL